MLTLPGSPPPRGRQRILRRSTLITDQQDIIKPVDQPPINENIASYILRQCCKLMLGGRAVLRRGRQRRVLSKHITRTSSQTNIDNHVKILVPAYFYAIILLFALVFFTWKFVCIASVLYFVFRLVILPPLSVRLSRYHKRAQGPGPTIREKWYYNVDYWISTNP